MCPVPPFWTLIVIDPVLVSPGWMSFSGVSEEPPRSDSTTIVVGAMVIGIAVDDTIHFMHKFHRYFEETGDLETAARIQYGDLRELEAALAEEDGEDRLVLINNFVTSQATPRGIRACVKEMAAYGDWIEKKLSGEDVL